MPSAEAAVMRPSQRMAAILTGGAANIKSGAAEEGAMRAQSLIAAGQPLAAAELPTPRPGPRQVLIAVRACAVCRTDLHVVDGELPEPKLPLVPGHEIVGIIVERGEGAEKFAVGDRVGVPWLGWTCGVCDYCRGGRENLCDRARFTGYQIDGGYAELTVADERYCFADRPAIRRCRGGAAAVRRADRLPHLADGRRGATRIGIYGFGAAAHIVAQVARHQGRRLVRLHPAGRPGGAGFRPRARRRMGRRFDDAAARAARCGADLRPGRARWCRPPSRRREKAAPSSAAASI